MAEKHFKYYNIGLFLKITERYNCSIKQVVLHLMERVNALTNTLSDMASRLEGLRGHL